MKFHKIDFHSETVQKRIREFLNFKFRINQKQPNSF